MRRVLSRAEWIIFVSMLLVVMVAMSASITLAAMSVYNYGQNTIRIASIGTISCSASVPAKVYPGGTSNATLTFSLAKNQYEVSSVSLANFRLTSFTLNWGSGRSSSFNSVTQVSANTTTVATTAGTWRFALDFGADSTLNSGTGKNTTLTISAPLGAAGGEAVGGNPELGYLVASVTSITCNFDIDVEPIKY